jgi:mycothiol synthase
VTVEVGRLLMEHHPRFDLRPLGLEDAPWAADLLTECRPDEPMDPVVLGHRWRTVRPAWWRQRLGVLAHGEPVGCCTVEHPPWEREPERMGRLFWSLLPAASDLAGELLSELSARLVGEGAHAILGSCYEDDRHLRAAFERAGFRHERTGRAWELDLVANRDRLLAMTAQARERMGMQGIRLVRMAEHDDPRFWPAMTAFYNEVDLDIPRTGPMHLWTESEVRADLGENPEVRADRVWLALEGTDLAGLSHLTFPPVRGYCWTGLTATARAYRSRGIARAVKMETLAQAVELGVDRVRTDNDAENAPILHINETLGYRPIAGWVQYLARL